MERKSLSKIILVVVLGLGVAAVVLGVQFNRALANGESFTPMVIAPTDTYNQSTQTLSLGGTITDGTETYNIQAVCFGTMPGVYTVTGPVAPNYANWSIIDASGATLKTGSATYVPATPLTQTVFGNVCPLGSFNKSALTAFSPWNFNTSIDVSSLPIGSYTLKVVVGPSACATSFGSVSVCVQPPVVTGSAAFVISPPPPTVTGVTPTCSPSTIYTNGTSACTAAVTGTGSYSNGVTWTITNNLGSIDPSSGNYAAPGSSGTATVKACSTQSGYTNVCGTTQITVNAPIGQITVTSENTKYPSIGVPASWNLWGDVASGTVCSASGNILWHGIPCSGIQQTYSGLPADTELYNLPVATVTANVSGYSFNFIEQVPIAGKKNNGIMGLVQLSLDNAFSTIANAVIVSPTQWIPLRPSSSSAAFTILWTPDATMQVTTGSGNTVALDSSNAVTTPATVTNAGTPGSAFTWTATAATTGGGSWLVAPSGDNNPGVVNGQSGYASDGTTISLNSSVVDNLPNGTYYGTVTFTGVDKYDYQYNPIPPITIPVTLTVSNHVATGVSVTCTPSTVLTNGNSTCSATVSGNGGYSSGVTWTTNFGSIDASGYYTAPGSAGSATITACSTQSTSVCGTTEIAVNSVPTVAISASPSTIIAGNLTQLSWNSSYATSCSASNGWSGSQSTSGNANESPTNSTTYTITCTGPGGSASASTNVTVRPPAPIVALSASLPVITAGGQTTLSWSSTNANSCSASNGWSGSQSTSGNANESPTSNTTYTITCTGPGGQATASTNVTVKPSVTGISVTCSPTTVLTNGNSSCSATVSGTGSYSSGVTWTTNSGSVDTSGNYTAPGSAGTATVTACSTQSGYTNVCGPATITVNTPPPGPAVTLSALPPSITLGQPINLTINTANVTSCTGSGDWSGPQPTSGNVPETPGSAGTATYNISCTGPGGSATSSASVVVNPVSTAGSIVVTSENAEDPSILVPASWDLGGDDVPGGFVCSTVLDILWPGTQCSGTQQTYSGLPTDNDSYTILSTVTTTVPGYSFNSIEQVPIAGKKNDGIMGLVQLSLDNAFSTIANAVTISPSPTQVLSSSYPSAAFTILWTPDASMQISPSTVSLNSLNVTTANVTVTNTGAPASAIAWTATAATTGGGSWLVAPSGDSNPGIVNGPSGNASDNATVSFDPSVVGQLANGTYHGTVTFQGTDKNDPSNTIAPSIVSVTLTVSNTPVSTVTGVSVTCSPATVTTNGTSACTATVSGTGSYGNGVTWTTNSGSINTSGSYTAPGSGGVFTVTACSSQSGFTSVCGTAPIAVVLPACQSSSCQATCPQLTSSLLSIIPPESTDLQSSCSNVTECELTGGGQNDIYAGSGSIDVSTPVSPTSTTTYTLTCVNGNYSNDSTVTSVTVTVGGSSYCEQDPNGLGCQ